MGPTSSHDGPIVVERVQVGVRLERRLVKVLKGLAEFESLSLGQLIEKIVLHSFEPIAGREGDAAASPHSVRALAAIHDLRRIYDLDDDVHATRQFAEPADASADEEPTPRRRRRPPSA